MGLGGIQAAWVRLLVQGRILPAAGQGARIVPVRQDGWREVREVKGKDRENCAFVYLSGRGQRQRGVRGGGGFAPWHWTCLFQEWGRQ